MTYYYIIYLYIKEPTVTIIFNARISYHRNAPERQCKETENVLEFLQHL